MNTIRILVSGTAGSGLTTVADVVRQALEMVGFKCDASPEVRSGLDDLPPGSFDLRCDAVSRKTRVLIEEVRAMPQARGIRK